MPLSRPALDGPPPDAARARIRLATSAWSALLALQGGILSVDLGELTGAEAGRVAAAVHEARRAVANALRILAVSGSPLAAELVRDPAFARAAPCEACGEAVADPLFLDGLDGIRVLLCVTCFRDTPSGPPASGPARPAAPDMAPSCVALGGAAGPPDPAAPPVFAALCRRDAIDEATP